MNASAPFFGGSGRSTTRARQSLGPEDGRATLETPAASRMASAADVAAPPARVDSRMISRR